LQNKKSFIKSKSSKNNRRHKDTVHSSLTLAMIHHITSRYLKDSTKKGLRSKDKRRR
jgi:hypothetical protein